MKIFWLVEAAFVQCTVLSLCLLLLCGQNFHSFLLTNPENMFTNDPLSSILLRSWKAEYVTVENLVKRTILISIKQLTVLNFENIFWVFSQLLGEQHAQSQKGYSSIHPSIERHYSSFPFTFFQARRHISEQKVASIHVT